MVHRHDAEPEGEEPGGEHGHGGEHRLDTEHRRIEKGIGVEARHRAMCQRVGAIDDRDREPGDGIAPGQAAARHEHHPVDHGQDRRGVVDDRVGDGMKAGGFHNWRRTIA